MDYLRGLVPYPMLAADLSENPQKKEIDLGTSSISIATKKSEAHNPALNI